MGGLRRLAPNRQANVPSLPNNPKVQPQAVAPARMAVIRFSGRAWPDAIAANTAALSAFLKAQRLKAIGPVTLAQYDPPWKLWFLRRNELMVPVVPAPAE